MNRLGSVFWIFAATLALASPLHAVQRADELLIAVSNAPLVQMLVPGFTVAELPLELNNLNNLVYAPDGRLFALGYDGNVHQLKDTNGDGLEDTATYFFKNETNQILPSIGMAWGPGGLYIASQKRILRLRDKGDGTAELETVTGDWVKPTGEAGSGLDSVGIAVDPQGNVFFGLGADKWNEAYMVDPKTGKSGYNIGSERGTIEQLSPDWKQRKAIATGLRFTISLAFNANGDLFCTDQEGATWLPNGNPFDELLHIQTGRHYGFPPQHPQHLPKVIDEPSVFDYSPQHQSTCGLHFNEPAKAGGQIFGPQWWRGDAIVAGESRGKIWHTRLVKTAAGYVAHTDLIACLQMLTVDAVPTPMGDLLVACHSGKPDWGTGPGGKGKLFKISYTDSAAPQPVFAYAVSPTETRVTFDRPLDPARLKNLSRSSGIVMGVYAGAGDRFELMRPGYQVVKDQQDAPRGALSVLTAGVTADNCSVVLQTASRTKALNYGVTIPASNFQDDLSELNSPEHKPTASKPALGDLKDIDLLMDLTGVEAKWTDSSGQQHWSGWLPHLDLHVARALLAPSEEHRKFFDSLSRPGVLTLRCQLDLSLMLHPKTQPGAHLDYEYPPETVSIVLKTDGQLEVKTSAPTKRLGNDGAEITFETAAGHWLPLEVTLRTGVKPPRLDLSWFTTADRRPRALARRRLLMPWVTPTDEPLVGKRQVSELAGGDWARGKKIFFGEQAICFKCHQAGGEGGKIGPDLSSLTQRDYASVLRDIVEPSAAINPDHLAYHIELKDAESLTGVVLETAPERIVVGQVNGQTISVPRNRIAGLKASSVSLMPEGLLKPLTAAQQKDLLTFLLTEPSQTSSH